MPPVFPARGEALALQGSRRGVRLIELLVRTAVELEIESNFPNDEQDQQKERTAESHDGESPKENRDVQDHDATIRSHHEQGRGGATEFASSQGIGSSVWKKGRT